MKNAVCKDGYTKEVLKDAEVLGFIEEYEQTHPNFAKSLHNAKSFRMSKDNGPLLTQLLYFGKRAQLGDYIDALMDVYNVAYRRGYEKAKRDLKDLPKSGGHRS